MKLRQLAIFDADLPIDETYDEAGEVVVQAGKAASIEITKILQALGCEVEEPEYEDEHGWQFNFSSAGASLWCQVTYIDEWYLTLACPSRLFGPSKQSQKALADLLPRVDAELQKDPRFTNVLWHHHDKNGPGSPHP